MSNLLLAIGIACAILGIANCVGALYCAMTERYLVGSLMLANYFVFGLLVKSDLFG